MIEQGVVTVGRSRWSVGHADDLVLLGLWDCGDVPTPAVIRPTTGEVWVFPRWAAGGEEVAADRVAELGGVAWAVPLDDDDDGCHEIGLARHDGSRAIVDPRSGA